MVFARWQRGDGETRSTPVVYKWSLHGWMVFCWGEKTSLRAWKVNANLTLTFLASSDETASPNTGGLGGMPSGMISLSANGSTPAPKDVASILMRMI